MKRFLSTLAFCTALAPAAFAADPAAPESADRWTGFYAGVHAGYGWGENYVYETTSPALDFTTEPEGGVFGAQLGYNHQFGGFVFGVEIDGSLATLEEKTDPLAPLLLLQETEVDYLASARLRAGVAFDRILVFATGGIGFAGWSDQSYSDPATPFGDEVEHERTGWVVGGGVEYAISSNWSAKLDYLHYDLGDDTVDAGTFWGIGAEDTFETEFDVVRAGLNYKF